MRRYKRIMAAGLMLAALRGLAGCTGKTVEVDFLPEAHNDELLVLLPEDWQFLADWQTSENVPQLLLIQGETMVTPMQFGYNWGYYTDAEKQEICSYIACGMHPLDAVKDLSRLDKAAVGEQELTLLWQAEPTAASITAYAYDEWQQRKCGNTEPWEITNTEIAFTGGWNFKLLADEHSYVYVINGEWLAENTPGIGGNSMWAFYVE